MSRRVTFLYHDYLIVNKCAQDHFYVTLCCKENTFQT